VRSERELFTKHPKMPLIFSNLILRRGLTGAELIKRVLEEKPNTLVAFATGYQNKG
jgi:hypothetical protein